MRRLPLAVLLAGWALGAGSADAATGELAQKPGAAGCIAAGGAVPCASGSGLARPEAVAVSPDGASVYVASHDSGAVAVFDRAPDGALAQKPGAAGCVAQGALAPCGAGAGLQGAAGVAVSPDGKSVYVASRGASAVAVFDRAANGTLTQKAGAAGCIAETPGASCLGDAEGLRGANSVAVSADGKSVYVAGWGISSESDTVAVFDRAVDGTLVYAECLAQTIGAATPGCVDAEGMLGPESLALSPDGTSLYLASALSDSVAVFDRAADGSLQQKEDEEACVANGGPGPWGECAPGVALDGAYGIAVSPDGASVYVTAAATAGGAVAVFDRAAGGALTQKPGAAGCVSGALAPPCAKGTALEGASSVAVSPDGANVYVSSLSPGSVAVFGRGAGGTLAQPSGPAGCVSAALAACASGAGVSFASAVTVSPSGTSVYVTSQAGALAVFDRGPAQQQPSPSPPPGPKPPPTLSGLKISPATFRAALKGPSTSAKAGATVSFRLSQGASVRFKVERVLPGRRKGKACVKPTPANAGAKRCTRLRSLAGSFAHAGAAGRNSFSFSGRLRGHRLSPGRYRLRATPADAAGMGAPARTGFRILPD